MPPKTGEAFCNVPWMTVFEERMLQGMVIGAVKGISIEERLDWVAWFVPKINNWSVCDSFCAAYFYQKGAGTCLAFSGALLCIGSAV